MKEKCGKSVRFRSGWCNLTRLSKILLLFGLIESRKKNTKKTKNYLDKVCNMLYIVVMKSHNFTVGFTTRIDEESLESFDHAYPHCRSRFVRNCLREAVLNPSFFRDMFFGKEIAGLEFSRKETMEVSI